MAMWLMVVFFWVVLPSIAGFVGGATVRIIDNIRQEL